MKVRVVRDPTIPGRRPYGLPAPLPSDERMLWQGAPSWRGLMRRVMHLRSVGLYFGVLLAVGVVHAVASNSAAAWFSLGTLLVLGSVAIGLLALFAYLMSRTTVYTITDKRVVMRIGIALPASINLPYRQVEQASVRMQRDGTADVALLMIGEARLGWVTLWPHVRPWRTARVQPMLRCLPDGRRVAELLGRHLRASVAGPVSEEQGVAESGAAQAAGMAMAAGD